MKGEFASHGIGELPLNNVGPFLQALSHLGITVGDILPFLTEPDYQLRLVASIKSLGFGLTDQELRAAEILGWHNVVFAPSVHAVLKSGDLGNAKRDIVISENVLRKYAAENTQFNPRRWSLVYTAPISLNQLQSATKHLSNGLKMRDPFKCSWARDPAIEGYKLVSFGVYEATQEKDFWDKQEEHLKAHGLERLSPAEFAQAAVAYSLLNRPVPPPQGFNGKSHWAIRDRHVSVRIDPPSYMGDSTDVEVTEVDQLTSITCAAKVKM